MTALQFSVSPPHKYFNGPYIVRVDKMGKASKGAAIHGGVVNIKRGFLFLIPLMISVRLLHVALNQFSSVLFT